ncbi:MAG: PEP-CTERM sorting domain-containing protein [Planctomycetaceae bacterium]|nr:MAG: PEP-CTERM sorting domain-containing protein [Planctomycetaceae bacterium]
MLIGKKTATLIAMLLVLGVMFSSARADSFSVGTGGDASWLVTVYGSGGPVATNQPAYQIGSWISFTSNAFRTGQWVNGANSTLFKGLWVATSTFELPADVVGASLDFSNFLADDRAVLEINGHRVGASALIGAGAGKITTPTGTQSVTYGTTSGDISEYLIEGINTITIIANNTASPTNLSAKTRSFKSNGDAAGVSVDITLNYVTQPVPEPATMALLAIGGLAMLRRRRAK